MARLRKGSGGRVGGREGDWGVGCVGGGGGGGVLSIISQDNIRTSAPLGVAMSDRSLRMKSRKTLGHRLFPALLMTSLTL